MQANREPLDRFGKLIITTLRDPGIAFFEVLEAGQWKAPSLQQLQREVAALTPAQRTTVRRCIVEAIDTAVHDFLLALQEAHDSGSGIRVSVNEVNIAAVSDGLHGEPFGQNGWRARYSRFGESP
jgi:hypothetical protein